MLHPRNGMVRSTDNQSHLLPLAEAFQGPHVWNKRLPRYLGGLNKKFSLSFSSSICSILCLWQKSQCFEHHQNLWLDAPTPSVRLLDSDGHRIPDSSGLSDCNTPCPTSELLPPRETTAPSCWLSPPLLLVAYKSRQRQQITCFVLPILSFWKSKEKSVCHCFKLSHQKVWAVLSTLFWTFQINFGPVKFWVRFQQNQVSTGSRFILRRVYI